MAVRHCSTARRVARGTSDQMSRTSLAGSPCIWVFCRASKGRDVFRAVASWSHCRYKRACDALSELGML